MNHEMSHPIVSVKRPKSEVRSRIGTIRAAPPAAAYPTTQSRHTPKVSGMRLLIKVHHFLAVAGDVADDVAHV